MTRDAGSNEGCSFSQRSKAQENRVAESCCLDTGNEQHHQWSSDWEEEMEQLALKAHGKRSSVPTTPTSVTVVTEVTLERSMWAQRAMGDSFLIVCIL